jgi:hypothetical protein
MARRGKVYGEARHAPDPCGRECLTCERVLPTASFYTDARTPSGLRASCKDCTKRSTRTSTLRLKYGLTEAAYAELVLDQDGVCAVCGEVPPRALVVDHCHRTGKVRALLCDACNKALGLMKDDSARLRMAARYVDYHA